MTDDDLERMLLALPLEAPPADLRARIFGATIYRPRPMVQSWEIWAIGTFVALLVWLSCLVFTASPNEIDRIARAVTGVATGLASRFTTTTALWTAVGVSVALWLSQLSLPQRRRLDS